MKKQQSFKAFNMDLECRGYKFEVGKTFKEQGKISICSNGFHACKDPLNVLHYYNPVSSRFAKVTQSGKIVEAYAEDKLASEKIHIDKEIKLEDLYVENAKSIIKKVKPHKLIYKDVASVKGDNQYIKNNHTFQGTLVSEGRESVVEATGSNNVAICNNSKSIAKVLANNSCAKTCCSSSVSFSSSNDSYALCDGHSSMAIANGYNSISKVKAESSIALAKGSYSKAICGNKSIAIATDISSIAESTGYCSASIVDGYFSLAIVRDGDSFAVAKHTHSIAMVYGEHCYAKGVLGSHLIFVVTIGKSKVITKKVDGKKILPDTFYTLKGNTVVEAPVAKLKYNPSLESIYGMSLSVPKEKPRTKTKTKTKTKTITPPESPVVEDTTILNDVDITVTTEEASGESVNE